MGILKARGLAVASLVAVALSVASSAAARPLSQAPLAQSFRTCPLTGLPAPAEQVDRPAVAVRVSNSPDALPQTGLTSADVVIETLVEGGLTRLIAVFHCSPATSAGPVRSARAGDAVIAGPFAGLLAFAGANPTVYGTLDASGVRLVPEAHPSGAVYRDPPLSLDVNSLRANVDALRELASGVGLTEPLPKFRFGDLQTPSAATSIVGVHFGETLVTYRWASGLWRRYQDGKPFLDSERRHVTARNVLIQEVDAFSSPLLDAIGTPSSAFDLAGPGRAWLFRDGRVVTGTWARRPGGPVFRTQNGALMSLDRGRTWIEMVPSRVGDLKGTIAYR